MPFYQIAKMVKDKGRANPRQQIKATAGEFMKAGIVTKPEGVGPPLHMHPNEEQFTLILEGELHYVLGDEERIVGPGDLIHIPRFTNHRSRSINGSATFFTVKSPAGEEGHLDEDYNMAQNAEVAEKLYDLAAQKEKAAGKKKKKKTTKKRKATKKKATKKKKKSTRKKPAKKRKPAKKTTRKKTTRKKPAKKTSRKSPARKKTTKRKAKTTTRRKTKKRR
ncbi:MAG: cupin domain-containing protein [Rhodospirillales bacterium]